MSALGQKQDIDSPLSHWHMAIRGFMAQPVSSIASRLAATIGFSLGLILPFGKTQALSLLRWTIAIAALELRRTTIPPAAITGVRFDLPMLPIITARHVSRLDP